MFVLGVGVGAGVGVGLEKTKRRYSLRARFQSQLKPSSIEKVVENLLLFIT
jgi:hypothetical protein